MGDLKSNRFHWATRLPGDLAGLSLSESSASVLAYMSAGYPFASLLLCLPLL